MKNMDNQKPSIKQPNNFKYFEGDVIGPYLLKSRLPDGNYRWKVQCTICGSEHELGISSITAKAKEDKLYCANCRPRGTCKTKYQPGEIIAGVYELIRHDSSSIDTSNYWFVKCIKCGKEQRQSIPNMRRHKTEKCVYCDNPNAHRNYNGGGGTIKLTLDERVYNYYKFRILQFNENPNKKYKEFLLTQEEFSKLIRSDCHYCGAPPSLDNIWNKSAKRITQNEDTAFNGVDRVDSDKGYTIDNCVPCCKTCNRMKWDLSEDVFYEKIAVLYNRKFNKGLTTTEKHESELSRVDSSESKRADSDTLSEYDIV